MRFPEEGKYMAAVAKRYWHPCTFFFSNNTQFLPKNVGIKTEFVIHICMCAVEQSKMLIPQRNLAWSKLLTPSRDS